jgi:hypothetical protein
MSTLYFNGAVNDDWGVAGNWWLVPNVTPGSVPTGLDDAIVTHAVWSNSGAFAEVATLTVNDVPFANVDIHVYDVATFTGYAQLGGSGVLENTVYVDNKAIFTGYARNYGYVWGNAEFDGEASNQMYTPPSGQVTGNAVFNGNSNNFAGNVLGSATFNNLSYFYVYPYDPTMSLFGSVVWNSSNTAAVVPQLPEEPGYPLGGVFYGSYGWGYYAPAPITGTVFTGAIDGDWNKTGNWTDGSGQVATLLPGASEDVTISNSVTFNSGSAVTVNTFTIGGTHTIGIPITVTTQAIFNEGASFSILPNGLILFNSLQALVNTYTVFASQTFYVDITSTPPAFGANLIY